MTAESQIREQLLDLAQDAPTGSSVPPTLVPRAHRRIAATLVSGALVLALVLGGGISALRSMTRSETEPAHSPSPSTGPKGTGIFVGMGGLITTNVNVASIHSDRIAWMDPISGINPFNLHTFAALPTDYVGMPMGWAADGSELLVGNASGLYVLKDDGSTVQVLQQGSQGPPWATISPDGTQVAYSTGGPYSNIYVVDATGGTPRMLAAAPEGAGFYAPSWSPDGGKIAFMTVEGRRYTISVMNADGSGRHALAVLPFRLLTQAGSITWSPDGSKLAFYVNPSNLGSRIYVVASDGSGLHPITQGGDQLSPTWSPDGRSIAFDRDGVLAFMNPDGSRVRVFTDVSLGVPPSLIWNPGRRAHESP